MLLLATTLLEVTFNIGTTADFLLMSTHTADVYNLTASLDFAGISFSPQTFAGRFVGNGFTVSNVHFEPEASLDSQVFLGVFGRLCSTTSIENVTFKNVSIQYASYGASFAQRLWMGCVAGSAAASSVSNVNVSNCSLISTGNMNARSVGGLFGQVASLATQRVALVNVSTTQRIMGDFSAVGFSVGGLAGASGPAAVNLTYSDFSFKSGVQFASVQAGGFFGRLLGASTVKFSQSRLNCSAPAAASTTVGGFVGSAGENSVSFLQVRNDLEAHLLDYSALGGVVGSGFSQVQLENVVTKLNPRSQVYSTLNVVPGSAAQPCTLCFANSSASALVTYIADDTAASQLPVLVWGENDGDATLDLVIQQTAPAAGEESSVPAFIDATKPCNCGANAVCKTQSVGEIDLVRCSCPASYQVFKNGCYPAGCFASGTVCAGDPAKCVLSTGTCQATTKSSNLGMLIGLIIGLLLLVAATVLLLAYLQKKKKKNADKKKKLGSETDSDVPAKPLAGKSVKTIKKLQNGNVKTVKKVKKAKPTEVKMQDIAPMPSTVNMEKLPSSLGSNPLNREPSMVLVLPPAAPGQVIKKKIRVKKPKPLTIQDNNMAVQRMSHAGQDGADGLANEPAEPLSGALSPAMDVQKMGRDSNAGLRAQSPKGFDIGELKLSSRQPKVDKLGDDENGLGFLDRQLDEMMGQSHVHKKVKGGAGLEEVRHGGLKPMKLKGSLLASGM